ncbi:MAG: NUDIX hydrolase [Halobacteriales archaeon]
MRLEALADRTPARPVGGYTNAAVLIPVLREERPDSLLFTRRNPDLDTHPGQMSFPGGRAEADDPDLLGTALREAREEIDLSPSDATIHGRLDPIRTVTGFEVVPYVAEIPPGEYRPDPAEVAEIVTVAVPDLLDPANYEAEHRVHPEHGPLTVHYFTVDGYTVWGATARILVQLLRLTHGWAPPPEQVD